MRIKFLKEEGCSLPESIGVQEARLTEITTLIDDMLKIENVNEKLIVRMVGDILDPTVEEWFAFFLIWGQYKERIRLTNNLNAI